MVKTATRLIIWKLEQQFSMTTREVALQQQDPVSSPCVENTARSHIEGPHLLGNNGRTDIIM